MAGGRDLAGATWLDELLYPERCVRCGCPDDWMCGPCRGEIRPFSGSLAAPALPSGRAPRPGRVFACAAYAAEPWSKLIAAIKYETLRGVASVIDPVILSYRNACQDWPFASGEGWTLVPVPTNPDHLEERGADHLEVWLDAFRGLLPLAEVRTDVLVRRSGRSAHAALTNPGAREAESEASVAAASPAPRRAILVDDVYTTGSTAQACARALFAAGAQEVEALVAAASFGPT